MLPHFLLDFRVFRQEQQQQQQQQKTKHELPGGFGVGTPNKTKTKEKKIKYQIKQQKIPTKQEKQSRANGPLADAARS